MSDIRQQITLQLDAYKDLQALKSAVSEWINQSDVTLPTLEKILAAHSSVDIDYTESDWEHFHQTGFAFDTAEATREEDLQRLQRYRETGHGIPHEQVSEWLSSIGTDREQPCPN
jgi:hypothetical protein